MLSANPTVLVSEWYHNGVVLSTNENVTVNKDSLSFKSITPEYNGSYTLYVNNSIGNLTVETNIGVYCKLIYLFILFIYLFIYLLFICLQLVLY